MVSYDTKCIGKGSDVMDPNNMTISDVINVISHLDDEHLQISDYYKTQDFLMFNNITHEEAKEEVRNLKECDLTEGPLPDVNKNRNYPVWIFEKEMFGTRCYIKIKIINKGKVAIIISLHEDER